MAASTLRVTSPTPSVTAAAIIAWREESGPFSAVDDLQEVSGIGPKIALAILSGMNADELALAIAGEDTARLAKVPGIGKKTAERLVLELRGKLGSLSASVPASGKALPAEAFSPRQDILHALLALGYNEREAAAALKLVPEDASVNDGIRLALKALAKV